MREWVIDYAEAYPLMTNILIFVFILVVLLLIRRFILNRLYKRFKGSENWYVTRKIAKWLNNII